MERAEQPDLGKRRFLLLREEEAPAAPPAASPPPAEAPADERPAAVVEHVRRCSRQGVLVRRGELGQPPFEFDGPAVAEVLSAIAANPDFAEIVCFEGKKDWYYFSAAIMATNYARMLYRLEEQDSCQILAEAVRFDCETYPRPYHIEMLKQQPYYFDDQRIEAALAMLERSDEFADIKRVQASNGDLYLYSEVTMTRDEAQGLCEWYAVEQFNNP